MIVFLHFKKNRKPKLCWLAGFLAVLTITTGFPALASHEEQRVTRLRPGILLFADPELRDPNFSQSVVLLVDYSRGGAMGLIINRPTEIPLKEALPDLDGIQEKSPPLYFGGPVARNSMVVLLRSEKPIEGIKKVLRDVYYTTSKDLLEETLQARSSHQGIRVYAGYSGWAPGQLDHEVSRGDWVIGKARTEIIFSKDPSDAWHEIFNVQEQIEIHGPGKKTVPLQEKDNDRHRT
jgi:putative transcriptional regulator